MTVAIILYTVLLALTVFHAVVQSRYIKNLKGQVQTANSLLYTTKEVLWERIVPNQQFPFADMEAMLTRLSTETNAGVKVLLRQKLTGKPWQTAWNVL